MNSPNTEHATRFSCRERRARSGTPYQPRSIFDGCFFFRFRRGAVVFVEFVAEGADADVEELGGVGAVAVALLEGGETVAFFHFGQ